MDNININEYIDEINNTDNDISYNKINEGLTKVAYLYRFLVEENKEEYIEWLKKREIKSKLKEK